MPRARCWSGGCVTEHLAGPGRGARQARNPAGDCVVFGVGNDARGDDALGPALMAWLEAQALPQVRLVADFQLNIEHALDLDGAALALFIDAGEGTPAPFEFQEIRSQAVRGVSSHALTPAEVLGVRARLPDGASCVPPAFVLCVRGEAFELGAPLSAAAQEHLRAAQRFLAQLLARPEVRRWRALCRDGCGRYGAPVA